MHGHSSIDVNQILEAGPFKARPGLSRMMWIFVIVGALTFFIGLMKLPAAEVWGAFYVNLLFWMGLSCGAAVTPAIFQIVRAKWAGTIRRIGEANSAFLPWAFLLFLCTYFGKEVLFPWARVPKAGCEWWMQPNFVYARFAILFGLLFFLICRFVKLSLREDIGLARELRPNDKNWQGWPHYALAKNWGGSKSEIPVIQGKLSWNAPLIIALYCVIYSLFAFEMVMAMDPIWYSNMYGGFTFVGNIYLGWAVSIITLCFIARNNKTFAASVNSGQMWDLGKLLFGFTMLWGYLFFSQFLPQWYGNLPEETQWLFLRTREYPWKGLSWLTFSCAFVFPFIVLISEDVKRVGKTVVPVTLIILLGVWLERYVTVMPQLSPTAIPLVTAASGSGVMELGIFLGFMGIYVLSVLGFWSRYPMVPVAHPLTHGSDKW